MTAALTWVVSRTCESGACVTAARDGNHVLFTSTDDLDDPELVPARIPVAAFAAFLADVRAGRFDELAG